MKLLLALILVIVSTVASEARSLKRSPCDGIHRCRCGTTQANYFGLPWVYKKVNLKQAIGWVKAFPRTSRLAPGVVVYQRGGGPTGHVSRIVSYSGGRTAIVSDDAGTYERDIRTRGAIYLQVNG